MRDSGLTPAPVILQSRQQRFAAGLAITFSITLRKLHRNPSSGTLVCSAVKKEQKHGRITEGMSWLAPGEESVVRTVKPDDATAAKRVVQCWAREKEAKVGAGVWMWWTDGLRSKDGRVGTAAVCKQRDEWRFRHHYLSTGRMEVFHPEQCAIGLALEVTIEKRETLQRLGVNKVAVLGDSHTGKNDLTRRVTHREAVFGTVIHSIFDAWHYEVLWTCA